MHAPDAADLRPGDLVKLRGTLNTAHTGSRAVVVGTHRSSVPPHEVHAIDVRYSARGVAIRVELDGPGELVRFEDPWPAAPPVARTAPTVAAAPVAATRPGPRRIAVAALAVVVPVTALAVWHHVAAPEERYSAATSAAAAAGGVDLGPSNAEASDAPRSSATPSAATPTPGPATGRVVAYSAGPVPMVVETGAEPRALPLAGIVPVAGCSDEYSRDLLELLPVGESVTVVGQGWYRTGDGVDVNAEIVRRGHAAPADLPGTPDPTDAAAHDAVVAAVPAAPAACA